MAEERERICAHVKAAKDWLGRAESSLEKEEDVRGGLNLMLAEAELQRVRETRKGKRFARFLAPALAVLLALGGVALQRSAEPTAAPAEKSPAPIVGQGTMIHEEKGSETLAERMGSAANLSESREIELPVMPVRVQESPIVQAQEQAQSTEPPQPQPALEQQMEKPKQTSAASPPTEDMQELMVAAGRVLRE
ncbi:hypothetical protein [uncultured Selenomonas sp.]|uniref:hypothetical protein n=1 Tax=uncultured Selenomonas sp. TaxID=159275 RepID=UPI0028D203EC|nr:hypothetical protein [uncultured Selenomonas sp.]